MPTAHSVTSGNCGAAGGDARNSAGRGTGCTRLTSSLGDTRPGSSLAGSTAMGTRSLAELLGSMGATCSTTLAGLRPKLLRLVCSMRPSSGWWELQGERQGEGGGQGLRLTAETEGQEEGARKGGSRGQMADAPAVPTLPQPTHARNSHHPLSPQSAPPLSRRPIAPLFSHMSAQLPSLSWSHPPLPPPHPSARLPLAFAFTPVGNDERIHDSTGLPRDAARDRDALGGVREQHGQLRAACRS